MMHPRHNSASKSPPFRCAKGAERRKKAIQSSGTSDQARARNSQRSDRRGNMESLNNSTSGNVQEDQRQNIVDIVQFYVEGVGILLIGSIGLVINIMALYILFRKQVMRNFHLLMCSLALYDFIHLILDIACFALGHFSNDYRDKVLLYAIPYAIPLTQISLTGSCYTTIAITVERFFAIRLPFFIQRYNIKARQFMVPVFVYGLVYNAPRFFEYRVEYQGCLDFGNGSVSTFEMDQRLNVTCENPYSLVYTEMRKTQLYISLYVNSMTLIFNTILPLVTMGILNYLIYEAMKKSLKLSRNQMSETRSTLLRPRQFSGLTGLNDQQQAEGLRSHGGQNVVRKREARITKASIGITLMFVICHTPRVIPNVFEVVADPNTFPKWLPILVSFNHLLITINSSFNFLFYLSYCRGNKSTRGLSNSMQATMVTAAAAAQIMPRNGSSGQTEGEAVQMQHILESPPQVVVHGSSSSTVV